MKVFCHNTLFGKATTAGLFFLMFFLILAVSSCQSAKHVVKETITLHDTTMVVQYQKDSVYLHDSTYVYMQGDTVFLTQYKTKFVERLKTDTVSVIKEVPIETTVEIEKLVERPLNGLEKVLQTIGLFALIGLFVYMAARFLASRIDKWG